MSAAPANGPLSVDRALDVLDAVAGSAGPVPAKALARRLGCSLSTVYNLLGPLTARGHVRRTGGGYVLGHRVPALYRAFQRQTGIEEDARELLRHVRRATGTHAYLSAVGQGRIAVVDSTLPVSAAGGPFAVGPDHGAHATAHGKVLLAALNRPARRRYLDAHGLPRLTDRTITSPERFEAELVRVRREGLAVSVGETDPAHTCLAVRLPGEGPDGSLRALSVSLPTADYPARRGELASVLTRAAAGS
ncbi:IclR family transcriptional regulator [Streptomyces ochraceiscleroticus]|uniref:IclR family transcriptional regulator n=1 Tax=Streptomyces ochraceiscleroticus TaxID=47761 RepID=A0ABW1MX17_9ACTN|nr:IclR family transcriptional regulator C-terminal domain-containing protein [Streptomyces ochraceiscleroticus]